MTKPSWFVRLPGGYLLPTVPAGAWVMIAVAAVIFIETTVFVFSRAVFQGPVAWIAFFAVVIVTVGIYLRVALSRTVPAVPPVDTRSRDRG